MHPDLIPGATIDARYVLEEQVGSGGAGTVWKARDLRLDAIVAIKFLDDIRPDQLERFGREARLVAQLHHPAIVRSTDFGPEHTPPYFVMGYIDGHSLATELRPMSAPEVRRIISACADALADAHAAGIVHRDLKPGNILIGRLRRVYLTDFGLARTETEPGVTLANMTVGTPEYWAPEQARGEPPRAPADMYALGAIGFDLLTGRLPFPVPEGGDRIAASHLRLTQPAPRVADVAPHLAQQDPALADLINALLRTDPDERPSARQVVATLREPISNPQAPVPQPFPETIERAGTPAPAAPAGMSTVSTPPAAMPTVGATTPEPTPVPAETSRDPTTPASPYAAGPADGATSTPASDKARASAQAADDVKGQDDQVTSTSADEGTGPEPAGTIFVPPFSEDAHRIASAQGTPTTTATTSAEAPATQSAPAPTATGSTGVRGSSWERLVSLLLRTDGRVSRRTWWTVVGICWLAPILLAASSGPFLAAWVYVRVVFVLAALAATYVSVIISAKRFHDRDESGWLAAIGFVPWLGWVFVIVWCGMLRGTKGPNRFGQEPLR